MGAWHRLRAATRVEHQQLEQTDFARSLLAESVGRQEYVDFLRAQLVIVANVHTLLARHGSPGERLPELDRRDPLLDALLDSLHDAVRDWESRLVADLSALAPVPDRVNHEAQRAAHALVDVLMLHVGQDTGFSLGLGYVLRGAHQGNLAVAAKVERALGLDDPGSRLDDPGSRLDDPGSRLDDPGSRGTRFLRATEADGAAGWRRFVAALDECLRDPAAIDQAIRGALATFAGFHEIMRALVPGAPRSFHASVLNPEAGGHRIPAQIELLALAAAVADQASAHFPYLRLRFQDRGQRFARSDSAWLLTLCSLPEAAARRQIDWLARVLSSRGIPSRCLEVHLRLLHRALQDEGAPTLPGADRLEALAHGLAERRAPLLPERHFTRLAARPIDALGPRGAEILVSAVIDQRLGLGPCADNIRAWASSVHHLDDPARAAIVSALDQFEQAVSP